MRGETFLTKLPEKIKHPQEYVLEEMKQDRSLFSENGRAAIDKLASGQTITGEGHGQFDQERKVWWQNKYGFPFELKAARNELILRKYASQEKQNRASVLQKEMFKALETDDSSKLVELKKAYLEEFPDQLEGIEVIFGFKDFFDIQDRVQNKSNHGEARTEDFKNLTEYQFLFTHFIIQNKDDKEFLSAFWEVGSHMAEKTHRLKDFHRLQRGLLSQVAAFHLMKELGAKPRLSHPREDAFSAVDLWVNSDTAVQIKGRDTNEPTILESKTVSFPAVEVDQGEKKMVIDTYLGSQLSKFRAKIDQYGKFLNKELSGYLFVIPYSKIDFITGKPAEGLVEFFRDKLKGELKEAKFSKE